VVVIHATEEAMGLIMVAVTRDITVTMDLRRRNRLLHLHQPRHPLDQLHPLDSKLRVHKKGPRIAGPCFGITGDNIVTPASC
jgi:hypothetical protein